MPRQPGPRRLSSALEAQIALGARAEGITVARYRDRLNRIVLLATLERAVEQGVIDTYHVKGGAAIELRFGMRARATRDIDLELAVAIEQLPVVFAAALAVGYDDFTFALRTRPRAVREDAVHVEVAMSYRGLRWATIDVDLAPAQAGAFADTLPIGAAEIPSIVGNARAMKTEFLIAQKIHAATRPDEPDYQYYYARHVVDVLFLATTGVDLVDVRTACHAVFAARAAQDGRDWPPELDLPTRWLGDYDVTLREYDLSVRAQDVPAAFSRFLFDVIGNSSASATRVDLA